MSSGLWRPLALASAAAWCVLASGCYTAMQRASASSCANQLTNDGYIDAGGDHNSSRNALQFAESYCRDYTPDELVKAKQLLDQHYFDPHGEPHGGNQLYNALSVVRRFTPAQMECAKAAYLQTPVADRGLLTLSDPCRHAK